MRANYEGGGYGYGHAKTALYEKLLQRFVNEREQYNFYMNNLDKIDEALSVGASKAKPVANNVLQRVREKLGY